MAALSQNIKIQIQELACWKNLCVPAYCAQDCVQGLHSEDLKTTVQASDGDVRQLMNLWQVRLQNPQYLERVIG